MTHEEAMQLALAEAQIAFDSGDVPVGAVLLAGADLVARAHNEKEARQDPTAHAEMLVLRAAAETRDSWRLEDLTMVVTLEPCVMCAGALVAARLSGLVFGAFDPKAGATGSLYNVCADPRLNHELPVFGGVLEEQCGTILREFFTARRRSPTEL